jgi:hypothetical protein
MSLVETADEVRELHAFFEAWLRGELPHTNDRLERLEAALGAGFQLIGPDGVVRPRATVIDDLDDRHGARRDDDGAFRIEIEAVEPQFESEAVCQETYHEHQRTAGEWRGRHASALFERAPAAPGDVVRRHLHETWLGE